MKTNPSSSVGRALRKLAFYGAIAGVALYGLGVTAGYFWLHHVRKIDQVRWVDVALFRVGAVRSGMAAQQFAQARVEWEAKRYQPAYLYFSTAVHNAPDDVPGRLNAATFLRQVGATNLGISMLEEGLARAPEDRRLIEGTFDLLLGAGRDAHTLELLHKLYRPGFSGGNAAVLQTYELRAVLSSQGTAAAKKLIEGHPELRQHPPAAPLIAQVWWDSQERLKAIELLSAYIREQPADFANYALLAGWQETGGLPADAVQTANRALRQFPAEVEPRVLLIEALAAQEPDGITSRKEIDGFLKEFSDRPPALAQLAALAGRKGWVDLARTLYEVGANRQSDVNFLALAYGDALSRSDRWQDAERTFEQLDAQAQDAGINFNIQLRQRQVLAAAALGDVTGVREYARRLATLLHNDADALETCRRHFLAMGLTEAVAEFSNGAVKARLAAGK